MPKPTFLNLPDEKRERITELALDEFSTYPYRQASLSRIVSRAGIAKGSMYQYFENKLDLYRWLVTEELERRRAQWLEDDSARAQARRDAAPASRDRDTSGLFAELEQLVMTRVGFMLAHPRLARLAASSMEPSADVELRELHGALWRLQIDDLAQRLAQARSTGEVRPDLDPRTTAHMIDALIMHGTTNALLDSLGIDAHGLLSSPDAGARIDESVWRKLAHDAIRLIRGGIESDSPRAHVGGSNGDRGDVVEARRRPITRPNFEWHATATETIAEA